MLNKRPSLSRKQWGRGMCAASLLLLSACASNVVVTSTFPHPLVTPLSLNGELIFTDSFKNYTYFENARERRSLKSLNISEAQVSLFNQVFASLINVVDGRDTNVDLYIVPEVIDFQYSAPAETQLKQYEIWIKYRLKINNGANQKIADWVIKGYGKTPTSLMSSSGRAFNAAATVALRDVGAQLAIQFHRHKVIQQLLKQQPLSAVKGDTAVVPVSERAPSDVIRINDSEVANAL